MTKSYENTDAILRCAYCDVYTPSSEFFEHVEATLIKTKDMRIRNVRKPAKRIVSMAVAAMLTLVLSISAYAIYQISVTDYILRDAEQKTISLVGYKDTPEYEAYSEWAAYLDENGGSLQNDVAIGNYYDASEEHIDELEAVADKYALNLHTALVFFDNGGIQNLYDCLNIEPFMSDNYDVMSGYVYEDGTFKLEAIQFLENDDSFNVSIFVNVKGSFAMISSHMTADYEEWAYDTASGVPVDLVLDSDGIGFILAETDGAYVYASANTYGESLTKSQLETFADTIDFKVLSDRFDGSEHKGTTDKVLELYAQQMDDVSAFPTQPDNEVGQNESISEKISDWWGITAPDGYSFVDTDVISSSGNSIQIWNTNPIYSDGVHKYYKSIDGDGIDFRCQRYYTSSDRTESANREQFEEFKAYYVDGVACKIGGYEAFYVPTLYDGPHSGLWWLDADRDLVFELAPEAKQMAQDELVALAEEMMEMIP